MLRYSRLLQKCSQPIVGTQLKDTQGHSTKETQLNDYSQTRVVENHVGPHDVYPTIDVNFSILTRECKNKKLADNIFSSNFVLLSMC